MTAKDIRQLPEGASIHPEHLSEAREPFLQLPQSIMKGCYTQRRERSGRSIREPIPLFRPWIEAEKPVGFFCQLQKGLIMQTQIVPKKEYSNLVRHIYKNRFDDSCVFTATLAVMRMAIIGASGMVGRRITQHLRQLGGFEVLALSRNPTLPGYIKFDPEKDDWRLLGRLDVLINCAGIIRESRASAFYDVHVQLIKTLLARRSEIGHPRILHFSVLGADENNPIAFLKSKGVGDALLLQAEDVYILRPSIICFPENVLVQKLKLLLQMGRLMLNLTPVPKGFLQTRIQPVMPEDILTAISRLISEGFQEKVIPCAGPEALSFQELLNMASKTRKTRTIPVEIPKSLVEPVTKNFIAVWFPELISYDQFQLLFRDNVDDSRMLEKLTGRPPASTLPFWEEQFR